MSLKIGTHKCKVVAPLNGWFCESSKGTAGIRIPLEIISGPCEGELCEYVGWISHAAIPSTMKTLAKVFDFNGDLRLLSALNTGPFVGMECEIVCENEPWQTADGETKNSVKIKYMNRSGGGGGVPALPRDAAAALIAKLNAQCMDAAIAADAAEKPAKRAPRPPADPDLDIAPDDIPFLIPFIAGIGTLLSCIA